MTVVLGHTFQGATADFDHYLPFRIVYSFHMPMFMFVSGMTASLVLLRRLQAKSGVAPYVYDLRSKLLRLVLPFLAWALVRYFIDPPVGYNAATWFFHVLAFPDNGLWFLWVLFQCSCVFAIVGAAVQLYVNNLEEIWPNCRSNIAFLCVAVIVTGLAANDTLWRLPNTSGLYLTKTYFIYFLAGVAFHMMFPRELPNAVRWIPYVIFAALVPFWYRTELSPVATLFSDQALANSRYQYIVAFAGTLALVDMGQLFAAWAPAVAARGMASIGKRSLDIYAIHFYFLGYFPPLIAPIGLSLAVSLLLRTNPVTSWPLLGQQPMKIWSFLRPGQLAIRNTQA